jgi:signal transduction histidine kinase
MLPRKIGTQSALLVGSFGFLVLLLFGGFTTYYQTQFATQRLSKEALHLAKNTAAATEVQFLTEDYSVLESILSALVSASEVTKAAAVTLEGIPLVVINRAPDGNASPSYERVAWQVPEATERRLTVFDEYLQVMQPVVVVDKPLGWLILQISRDEVRQIRRNIVINTLVGGICVFLFGFPAIVLLMRKPAQVLQQAGEFAQNLDKMHGASTPVFGFTAEFEQLGVALNAVSSRLAEQDARIKNYTLELEEKNKVLDQALEETVLLSQAKSNFLANVSHELRTPINGISGCLQLLGTTDLNEEQRQFVNIAYESTVSMTKNVDKLLDFSDLGSGKLVALSMTFDPVLLGKSVLQQYRAKADGANLHVSLQVDDDLPTNVVSDANLLQRALEALLENAIKFTPDGSIRVHLSLAPVSWPTDSQRLRFSVQDTGIGMDEKVLNSLFEPFKQGDGCTTRRFGGSGLGLAIAKRLTTLLGGEIGVRSKPDQGSTFWIDIPVRYD